MTYRRKRRFVHECVRQADSIEQSAEGLADVERARLLDLILRAVELGRHLRRSLGKVASIPIRVRSERPAQAWEEERETQLIGREGALIEWRRPVEPEERLYVMRIDNGRQAHARVAWHLQRKRGQFEVGIEFLDCNNLGELAGAKANPRRTLGAVLNPQAANRCHAPAVRNSGWLTNNQ